jgi:serine/threonine-protein kinase
MGGTKNLEVPRRGQTLASELPQAGDVVGGKYRVLRVLGAGGMGVVMEAEHVRLKQRVALKFLHPSVADLQVPVARLNREARAASAIRSEHVARVLDVGTLDSGSPYIVMEYLVGIDLRGVLGRRGTLAAHDAVDYVLQACEALAEAHSLGIVHRDIKPSNLFLTKRADGSPLVKVLDFGIAKILRPELASADDDFTLTGNGMVVGSPRYTPPERLRDASLVDPRTDIWALGIVLHELLAGESPFEARTISELYMKIGSDPPMPVRKMRPDVPQGLEEVILRCLEKKPEQRYRDVGELCAALRPFAPEGSEISVRRVIRLIGAPASSKREPSDGEGRTGIGGTSLTRTDRRPTRRGAFLGLAAGAALGGCALLLLAGRSPEPIALARHGAPEMVAPPARPAAAPLAEAPSAPSVLPATSVVAPAAVTADAGTAEARPARAPRPAPTTPRAAGGGPLDPLGDRK